MKIYRTTLKEDPGNPRYTKAEQKWIDLVEVEKGWLFDAVEGFNKIKEAVEALQGLQEPFLDLEHWIYGESDNRPRFFTMGHAIAEKTFNQNYKSVPVPGPEEKEFMEANLRSDIADTKREIGKLQDRLARQLEVLERWKEEEE